MHFTAPTIALLSATLAVAAPTAEPQSITSFISTITDTIANLFKKDWDNKWNNDDWQKNEKLFYFDAEYIIKATPDQVVNNVSVPTPGQPGARGIFKYGINIAENTICYNITLSGVTGDYVSPAKTATHIHEGEKGKAGPPRIVFPNPYGPDVRRTSYGCLKGPFITGIVNSQTGKDQGDGFHVRQIYQKPEGFFTDSHTTRYRNGALRGQISKKY